MTPIWTFLTTLASLAFLAGHAIAAPASISNPPPRPSTASYQSPAVPVINPDAGDIVPNKYIVVYGDDFDDATVAAHQAYWATAIAKRNIAKRSPVDNRSLSTAIRTFSVGALRAMALEADDASAIEINSADEVSYIEADTRVRLSNVVTQQNATTGLARLSSSQPGAMTYTYDGSAGAGITAFVVDTGIMTDHQEFEGRAVVAFNDVDGMDTDLNGHGSHVAGTIGGKTFGVAKRATLIGVKVLDAHGQGLSSSILAGMDFGTCPCTSVSFSYVLIPAPSEPPSLQKYLPHYCRPRVLTSFQSLEQPEKCASLEDAS